MAVALRARMHLLPRFAIVFVALTCAAPVLAADSAAPTLGESGRFILSAERLFGVSHTTLRDDDDDSVKIFRVSAFWSASPDIGFNVPNPAVIPRLAGDYVVAPNLTIGAALGVVYSNFSSGGDTRLRTFGVLVAPRVGYVVPLGSSSTLWIRGGISYFRNKITGTADNPTDTWSHLAATIEPTFAFNLGTNAAITLAPVAEIPLSGRVSREERGVSMSGNATTTTFGANAGLLAHF